MASCSSSENPQLPAALGCVAEGVVAGPHSDRGDGDAQTDVPRGRSRRVTKEKKDKKAKKDEDRLVAVAVDRVQYCFGQLGTKMDGLEAKLDIISDGLKKVELQVDSQKATVEELTQQRDEARRQRDEARLQVHIQKGRAMQYRRELGNASEYEDDDAGDLDDDSGTS